MQRKESHEVKDASTMPDVDIQNFIKAGYTNKRYRKCLMRSCSPEIFGTRTSTRNASRIQVRCMWIHKYMCL